MRVDKNSYESQLPSWFWKELRVSLEISLVIITIFLRLKYSNQLAWKLSSGYPSMLPKYDNTPLKNEMNAKKVMSMAATLATKVMADAAPLAAASITFLSSLKGKIKEINKRWLIVSGT